MTPKQERFVAEYLIDLNAAAAARRAGYSERTANREGSRLLSKVDIQAASQAAQAQRAFNVDITAARLLREVALVAYSDIGEIIDFSGVEPKLRPVNTIPESARRAISSFKVKRHVEGTGDAAREVEVIEFRLWSKDSAHEKLMKHLGLLKETIEIKGGRLVLIEEIVDGDAPKSDPAAPGPGALPPQ